MKKTFRKLGMATALVLAMVGFAACGDDDDDDKGGNNNGKEQAIDAETIEGAYYLSADSEGISYKDGKLEDDYTKVSVSKLSNTKLKFGFEQLKDLEYSEWYNYSYVVDFTETGKLLMNHEYTVYEEEGEEMDENGNYIDEYYGYRETITITGNESFEFKEYEWSDKDKSDFALDYTEYYHKTSTSR